MHKDRGRKNRFSPRKPLHAVGENTPYALDLRSNKKAFLCNIFQKTHSPLESIKMNEDDKMLRFGVVGTGWITDEYIAGALATGLWELAAVYSRTMERAEEYAGKMGAGSCFDSIEAMAEYDKIDAVYIASPNMLHYEHCKVFLEKGKHVICEKPLTAQSDKLTELQKIADENSLIFLEAIMYMHLPQREELKAALAETGRISMAKLDFCQRSSKYDSYLSGQLPNIFNPAMETGALMDLGVYCVYPALDIFGLPESVSADAVMLESGVDAQGIITMKYPECLVTLTYSKVGQAVAGSEFQGKNGTVYVKSISRLEGIELRTNSGKEKQLHGSDEKSRLMGYEAADLHRYITCPGETEEEYRYCSELSIKVSRFMEETRAIQGIKFESDKS